MKTARQAALTALIKIEKDNAYSNIILDNILSESALSAQDKAFASMLFYGVIEKKLLLDYNLSQLCDKPIQKLDVEIKLILQMGLYQLLYMDSVPAHACVNESVKLCRAFGLKSAEGFVNGVLRSFLKNPTLRLPNIKKSKNKYYSVKYSCPEPIIKLWRQSYGDENTVGILESLEGRPPMNCRVNPLKTTVDKCMEVLQSEGVHAEQNTMLSDSLRLSHTGAVEKLKSYADGLFHIQDTASQLCCEILHPESGMTVLDVCSAPGGKSFTLAEMMNNRGRVISCDLYDHRLQLVQNGAKRLGIDVIETQACDSATYRDFPQADRVLCDAPCSGLGIMRRKPEIRYKEDLGLDTLPDLQYSILCNCSQFVKDGGLLVYSTCTLNPKENQAVARRFLEEHPDFEPCAIVLPEQIQRGIEENENELTLFPHINQTDGFFVSLFRRK